MSVDDRTVLERFPQFAIDQDNIEFFRGLLDRRLLINRCQDCGAWHTPPQPICRRCWSPAVVPTEVSGKGTVHAIVFLHQGAPVPVQPDAPYPLATIELAEQRGLRFTSTLVDLGKDDMKIGLAVELAWLDREGVPYPVFRPAS